MIWGGGLDWASKPHHSHNANGLYSGFEKGGGIRNRRGVGTWTM